MADGSKIFVAGAHGGVGQALAEKLDKQGNELILSARDKNSIEVDAAEKISLDVLDDSSVEAALKTLNEHEIAGLAYCIGSIDLKPFSKASIDDFKKAYDLNVSGVIKLFQGLADNLKRNKGSVVLFSTIAVECGFQNHAIIASAKGALEGLARSLAADFAPDIRVNLIAPSLTKTPIAEFLTKSEPMANSIAKMHPIARLGEPSDLANMASFLLSEESAWMTGQTLHVDGGRSTIRTKG